MSTRGAARPMGIRTRRNGRQRFHTADQRVRGDRMPEGRDTWRLGAGDCAKGLELPRAGSLRAGWEGESPHPALGRTLSSEMPRSLGAKSRGGALRKGDRSVDFRDQ